MDQNKKYPKMSAKNNVIEIGLKAIIIQQTIIVCIKVPLGL